jgi:hypothetical protein
MDSSVRQTATKAFPSEEPGVVNLGGDVFILWDMDGQGFIWHHPTCRSWATLRFMPDPDSTGHRLVSGGQEDPEHLTIEGSLLCPMKCGCHGFIRDGRWIPA